jgi:hypothetical protein
VAADREGASLLGEVYPGVFGEVDVFAKTEARVTPLSSFAPSLPRFLRGTRMRPAGMIQGYPTAA